MSSKCNKNYCKYVGFFNNKGYKLPTEPNDLIKKTLVDRRVKDAYIVFNEQQKVLDRKEYLKNWEWYIRKR